jgi:hypothetical protein
VFIKTLFTVLDISYETGIQFFMLNTLKGIDGAGNFSVRLLVIPAGVKPYWMKFQTLYLLKNVPSNQIYIYNYTCTCI